MMSSKSGAPVTSGEQQDSVVQRVWNRGFWGGFVDGNLAFTSEKSSGMDMPALYLRKDDAKQLYEDVRKISVKFFEE